MYDQLPEKLKEYPYFCGWKYENRGDRKTKVPKTVRGFNASTTNLKDFCPFGEIIRRADNFDGIGIVIAEDIVAIDIDHCIKDVKERYRIFNREASKKEYDSQGRGTEKWQMGHQTMRKTLTFSGVFAINKRQGGIFQFQGTGKCLSVCVVENLKKK